MLKHGIWHSKEERDQDLESSGIGVVRIELNFLKHRQNTLSWKLLVKKKNKL